MKVAGFFLILALVACDNTGADFARSVDIRMRILNNEGVNILLMDNSPLNVEDFRLYYYNKDMEYTLRYSPTADDPYFIQEWVDDGYVFMYPVFGEIDGTYTEGGRSTTYLDFGNGDIDTIQVSGTIKPGFEAIGYVWYNGKYMGDDAVLKGFDVVK